MSTVHVVYTQLKTELNSCIEIRNKLNTFMITTFVTVLGLAYKFAENQPYIFLFAQFLMLPVLWRIMNYKRTEYRLSKFIQEISIDPWEKERSKNNGFYFEFFTLSTVTSIYLLIQTINSHECLDIICTIISFGVTVVFFFLSYVSYKLSTDNCDKTWKQLFYEPLQQIISKICPTNLGNSKSKSTDTNKDNQNNQISSSSNTPLTTNGPTSTPDNKTQQP